MGKKGVAAGALEGRHVRRHVGPGIRPACLCKVARLHLDRRKPEHGLAEAEDQGPGGRLIA